MSESEEKLDERLAVERLNEALALQLGSALQYSLTAASILGLEAQAMAANLASYGDEELADARTLIEKIVSLGGAPTTEVAELRVSSDAVAAIEWLTECESAAIEALQAAIEPTGRNAPAISGR